MRGKITGLVRAMAVFPALLSPHSILSGQDTGREIFRANCVACHGTDGRGAPDTSRGFEAPKTFPDFTVCNATTREPNRDWSAIVHNGGPARGFSEIMPS